MILVHVEVVKNTKNAAEDSILLRQGSRWRRSSAVFLFLFIHDIMARHSGKKENGIMIRFATIGSNFIVDWFAANLPFCDGIEYAAVYSRTMERGREFAEKYGVQKVYDNLEELAMDEDIDAVYIASPNRCHYQQTMMMLNYGKHVLCEKPATSNEKELELILEAAKANHVVYMEAMKNIFTPGFLVVREQLEKIAPIRRATIERCKYSSTYEDFKEGKEVHSFLHKFSSGALMDTGCYAVHFFVELFGMPDHIMAAGVDLSEESDGAGTILVQNQDMVGEILYSKISKSEVQSQIQGENGTILIDDTSHPRKITVISLNGEKEEFHIPLHPAEGSRNNLIYEILEFQKLVEEQRVEHPYLEGTKHTIRVMDEARKQMGIVFPADKIWEV